MKVDNYSTGILKSNFLLFCIFVSSVFNHCHSQVKDSICIHKVYNIKNVLKIRPMDAQEFNNYSFNARLFKKAFVNDSLFITKVGRGYLQESTFIGEYTSGDSIHYIDFAIPAEINFNIHFDNLCYSRYISRNELPQLKKIILGAGLDEYEIVSFALYIQTNSGVQTFNMTGGKLPEHARKFIMTMREGQAIVLDNVKVRTPYGVRAIEGVSYEVRN